MRDPMHTTARILIVDDQEANVVYLERLLQRAGYTTVKSLTDPRMFSSFFTIFQPDLILLDLHMPHLDGFAVMEHLVPAMPGGTYLPILVLTADITKEAKERALSMGARDFLTKPFDPTEVLLRIGNLLETRFLHVRLKDYNQSLEQKVRERTRELEEAQIEILERLARAAEYRDDETGRHAHRVGWNSALLAQAIGLPATQVELIRRAAPLHDVGKIGIPDHILLKPGKLTPEEFEIMKAHTTIGAKILSGSQFALLQLAQEIAHAHHERWDGSGFPQGLRGEAIPLEARIVAVADAFDAMTSNRPYRRALTWDETWEVLWEGAGSQWDERLVEAFATAMAESKSGRAYAIPTSAARRASAGPAPTPDPRR